jgi:hypothetical protein
VATHVLYDVCDVSDVDASSISDLFEVGFDDGEDDGSNDTS